MPYRAADSTAEKVRRWRRGGLLGLIVMTPGLAIGWLIGERWPVGVAALAGLLLAVAMEVRDGLRYGASQDSADARLPLRAPRQ